jgi:sensor c-di-GMP phosphodiesterase-like protein
MSARIYLYDYRDARLFPVVGAPSPLGVSDITAGNFLERQGMFFQPLCDSSAMLCVVAAEARRDALLKGSAFLKGFLLGGALLGGALSLILILFYRRQRSLERQLLRAIRKGKLTLVYQPIVDLQTHAITGVEALARWVNEAGDPVSPEIFIALAEEKGFVGQITRLGLQRALEELSALLLTGNFKVTLNITAQDLADPTFFEYLESSIAAARVSPAAIGLELTERSTANQSVAIDAIARLRRSGHSVYIDDFGTGYSSLAYLHLLSADAIKLDRSFTQMVGTEAVTASVVPQVLDLAKRLDLLVVVEGIETKEQAEYFRRSGSRVLGQGYLFSRPLTALQLKKIVFEPTATGLLPVTA